MKTKLQLGLALKIPRVKHHQQFLQESVLHACLPFSHLALQLTFAMYEAYVGTGVIEVTGCE